MAYACESCHLVQLPSSVDPGTLFEEYLYFSSYSRTWLKHCRRYAVDMVARFGLTRSSQVIEVFAGHGLTVFVVEELPTHPRFRVEVLDELLTLELDVRFVHSEQAWLHIHRTVT